MNAKHMVLLCFIALTVMTLGSSVDARKKKTRKFNLRKFLHKVVETNFKKSTSQVAGALESACSDYATWCADYASYCSHSTVKQYCKATCKTCPTPAPTTKETNEECIDTHHQCSLGKDYGFCEESSSNIDFMRKNCPKTCKFCSSENGNRNCEAVDKISSCGRLLTYCKNADYKDYMKTNCAKTCGFCQTEAKCGIAKRRSINENGVIVGGVETGKGFYPWQVAIYYDDDFLCGGSLIGRRHVLTAAHCFKSLSKDMLRYEVVLGDHDRSENEGTEQNMRIKSISQHEEYRYESDTHDIAIIQLEEDAIFNYDVTPICLPSKNEAPPLGSMCHLTGWGKTHKGGSAVQRLMQVEMPIVKLSHCQERNTFDHHVVNERMLCTGYSDGSNFQSGCHGDSGGPLACNQTDGSWKLHGVVSWGSPTCNGLNRYTVFSKVSMYIDWINQKL